MYHNYHVISYSVYPFLVFCGLCCLTSSLLVFMKYGLFYGLLLGFLYLFFITVVWCKDIFLEGLSGCHGYFVSDGFKISIVLFIIRELIFFFGFFWSFFDYAISPDVWFGLSWPPRGVIFIDPFGIPFLNTVILLSSGVTVTWCHHNILENKLCGFRMFLTCILALMFVLLQLNEYIDCRFSLSDGSYGRVFFMLTGFHGVHVFFGTVFLIFNFFRIMFNHLNLDQHLSLNFSIVYWHFVDVVWLFLFVFVYWWSMCCWSLFLNLWFVIIRFRQW